MSSRVLPERIFVVSNRLAVGKFNSLRKKLTVRVVFSATLPRSVKQSILGLAGVFYPFLNPKREQLN